MISQGGCDIFIGDLVWSKDPQYGDCLLEVTKFMVEVSLLLINFVPVSVIGMCDAHKISSAEAEQETGSSD